ncbi:MAG: transposase, partial [Phycisphaerae bacterium]|nr:transposase [Phycisphaerae bacterium]
MTQAVFCGSFGCMARLARIVVPDIPHHLTQRGNRREDIFFNEADRQKYLLLLKDQCELYRLEVWAYCLMTNHVHLVVVPKTADALGQAMRRMNSQYAAYVNQRQGLCGHLWQGRFFSCPLDERHFWSAVRYVERNPVRAGLVERAEEYPWSSAAAHCGMRKDSLVSGDLEKSDHVGDWQGWLLDEEEADVERLRRHTKTGRPCGMP